MNALRHVHIFSAGNVLKYFADFARNVQGNHDFLPHKITHPSSKASLEHFLCGILGTPIQSFPVSTHGFFMLLNCNVSRKYVSKIWNFHIMSRSLTNLSPFFVRTE